MGLLIVYDEPEVRDMEKRGLSQEALKIIACMSMLVDHIGSVFVPGYALRIIGRIAFPIYCFLLAEGAHYTHSSAKYALRLAIGMLLSEIPYDLALKSGLTWRYQSVMVTLLLGYCAIEVIARCRSSLLRLFATAGCYLLAEALNTDYGGYGVLLIVLFSQARGQWWLQTVMLAMVAWLMNSFRINVMGVMIPIEMFALLAMIPIGLYSGKKCTSGKWVQWAFYGFYPLHLAILAILKYI